MKNQKGFSLIELLIVVVIIGIIAAIAIPNLLAARRAANEGSAISALRTLHGAQMTFAATYGNREYAGANGTMDGTCLTALGTPGLIDGVLSTGQKGGYGFVGERIASSPTEPAQFAFSALPTTITGVTATGSRSFGVATAGVLMVNTDLTAGHYAGTAAVNAGTPLNN